MLQPHMYLKIFNDSILNILGNENTLKKKVRIFWTTETRITIDDFEVKCIGIINP